MENLKRSGSKKQGFAYRMLMKFTDEFTLDLKAFRWKIHLSCVQFSA